MQAERVVAGIAFGANLGERERTLQSAVRDLERTPQVTVLRRSQWIETAPVGGPPGQGPYLNGAALIETALAPRELLERLLAIEQRHGRDRSGEEPSGPRTLDLDLLFHGDAVIDEVGLVVPHPRMEDRRFVLQPLAEIAPERRLVRSGRTVAERLAELVAGEGMLRLETPAEAREWCAAQRAAGRSLGFVPTMGALHEGHLELVRRSVHENEVTCVSVFVNPLQFNDASDLARYPRDFDGDSAKLSSVDCTMAFTGTLAEFFPGELDVHGGLAPESLLAPGPRAEGLEGAHRPGHFAGVATIVDRLFNVVAPDRAYFGRKDFQQTLVVEDLAERRAGPRIAVCPTVREASGLALSSRNELLSRAERAEAAAIYAALLGARAAWRDGVRTAPELSAVIESQLAPTSLEVEYAEVRDLEHWTSGRPVGALARAVALVAARAGAVRLIDNLPLSEDDDGA